MRAGSARSPARASTTTSRSALISAAAVRPGTSGILLGGPFALSLPRASFVAMDTQSRRVAIEIVEAGAERASTQVGPASRPNLDRAFLQLGEWLAEAETDARLRTFDSLRGDEPGAVDLRQRVATDLHRKAVELVTSGLRVAALAYQLGGFSAKDAIGAVTWYLRSEVAEYDEVHPDDELLSVALLNYVRGAGTLYRLPESSASELHAFAQDLLDNVVAPSVQAAACARAIELPA